MARKCPCQGVASCGCNGMEMIVGLYHCHEDSLWSRVMCVFRGYRTTKELNLLEFNQHVFEYAPITGDFSAKSIAPGTEPSINGFFIRTRGNTYAGEIVFPTAEMKLHIVTETHWPTAFVPV